MLALRKYVLLRLTSLFVGIGLLPTPASGQDLGELIEGVGSAYSELYLQPLADALGADMNAGLFHTARIGGGLLPLVDVYVGARLMGTFISDDDKTFDLTYDTEQVFRASDGQEYVVPLTFQIVDGPTFFGDGSPGMVTADVHETVSPGPDGRNGTSDDVTIDTTAAFDLLPGLTGTPIAPLIVPHVGVGSIAGTDLVLRYLPRVGLGDYGSVGLVGVGVRHSVSQYLPLLPISLSGQIMWQKLSIEAPEQDEIFAASAWAANVAVSKSLLLLTVYGGLQIERSSIDVNYTLLPNEPQLSRSIAFGLRGDNAVRLIAGAAFGLGPFVVNIDGAIGNRIVVAAGVGLSL